MSESILGWKIDPEDQAALLAHFPPRYAHTVADHVTHGRESEAPPLPDAERATLIGRADDGQGVEALVVTIGGSSDRWDGSAYHITWSLGEGRQAKESNAVIAQCGWEATPACPTIGLVAARWP